MLLNLLRLELSQVVLSSLNKKKTLI